MSNSERAHRTAAGARARTLCAALHEAITLMAAVRGVEEYVEAVFGEALGWRDECVKSAAAAGSLGPPDLCWLRKAPASGRGLPEGSYHSVLGLEPSEAGVCAYVQSLSLAQPAGLARLLQSQTVLEGAIYCCYDAFGRRDVRTELLPTAEGEGLQSGGATAVDAAGAQAAACEAAWRGARVSATLRRLSLQPGASQGPDCACLRLLASRPGPSSPSRRCWTMRSRCFASLIARRRRQTRCRRCCTTFLPSAGLQPLSIFCELQRRSKAHQRSRLRWRTWSASMRRWRCCSLRRVTRAACSAPPACSCGPATRRLLLPQAWLLRGCSRRAALPGCSSPPASPRRTSGSAAWWR
jgi:ChAPs (Chs5p-Arf1p-binding proteins)